jgi:2-dehydrotetronate isomerase
MPQFAANLSMLYNEHDFLDRFAAAAQDGFRAVEYLFPYALEAQELARRLTDHGLRQVLFNAPPGDWDAGERGLACLPGREAEFRSGLALALDYAETLACPRVHVMAGLAPQGADRTRLQATYETNLAWAAELAAGAGRDVLIEPINTRDIPGFFLNRQDEAHRIVQAIGAPNLKVQMDLYHCQIVEGDLGMKLRQYLPSGRVGHLQLAGVPERHEPDIGEVNFAYLFKLIDELSAACGWDGWVGCEYRPARGAHPGATSAGLGWLKTLGGWPPPP